MQQLFTITKKNRKILNRYLANTPKEALFNIPNGFNNNIWWNIAHVVVTEQKLVYGLSGLSLNISQELVEKYQKGTFPEEKPSESEMREIEKLLLELPEQTNKDYNNKFFKDFKSYMTSPQVELNSVEDAIAFNVFHEGLHLGSIMALSRVVRD